jgi:hypothetical protein
VTTSERNQILDALEAWRLAERAYSDQLAPYLTTGWLAEGPPVPPEKAPDSDTFKELKRLRKAADEALKEFERRCGT